MRTVYRRARVVAVFCLLTVSPMLAGCGVIFGGTHQVVRATSSPEGATIATRPDTAQATTPASLELARKNEYVLTFSMPGYSSQQVQVRRSVRAGIVVADIILCCLTVIVDAITGGWYQLSPDAVSVTLAKTNASMPGPETVLVTLSTKSEKGGARVNVASSTPGVHVAVSAH
jgi:hypothetical protein